MYRTALIIPAFSSLHWLLNKNEATFFLFGVKLYPAGEDYIAILSIYAILAFLITGFYVGLDAGCLLPCEPRRPYCFWGVSLTYNYCGHARNSHERRWLFLPILLRNLADRGGILHSGDILFRVFLKDRQLFLQGRCEHV